MGTVGWKWFGCLWFTFVKSDSPSQYDFDATQFVDYIDSTHTSAIDQYALLGGQEFDIGSVNLFTGIKLRVTGSGLLHLTIYNEDSTLNEVLSSTTLSTAPGKELAVRSNFKCERGYFKLEND